VIVSKVSTTRLRVPYLDPPNFSAKPTTHRELLIVEVETNAGITGVGYLQPLAGGLKTLETCIHEMLVPLVTGQTVCADDGSSNVEALWSKMWDATFIQGRMGITVMALSAIDIALWDACGKLHGLPLFRLWGGHDDPLPIYGSGCFRGLGQQGMIERAEAFVADGFDAIKMQTAHLFDADQDVANVGAMRDTLGDEIEIMVDVNQGWDADAAIATGRRLEPFRLHWLEEPVKADDFDGYRRVAEALDIPIVGGENHFTHHDMRVFLDEGFLPILQPDVMRGGFTELRRIARLSEPAGIRIAPHLFHELMIHLNASIPNASWLEYMGWADDLFIDPVPPRGGFVTPPERPGHGLEFNPGLVRRYRVDT
jgi:D-arabinonate dehydratase